MVGAGGVGCSLAFHLARAGARVTVFDKASVCAGMSARSGALVRMHYTFAPEAELACKSLEYFENWEQIVGGRCGLERTGCAVVVGADDVHKLRAKLANALPEWEFIHTHFGFGYRFQPEPSQRFHKAATAR